jgi:hypothetical protein
LESVWKDILYKERPPNIAFLNAKDGVSLRHVSRQKLFEIHSPFPYEADPFSVIPHITRDIASSPTNLTKSCTRQFAGFVDALEMILN